MSSVGTSSVNHDGDDDKGRRHCILYYKYHPLTDNHALLDSYRVATEALCASLNLNGRVLLGLSSNGEGINGTLAGSKADLDAYVNCMLGVGDLEEYHDDDDRGGRRRRRDCVIAFRDASRRFFADLNLPELLLAGPDDFKWSSTMEDEEKEDWFPDLNVKIVKEIVSSGGAFSDITTEDTSVGYLTPKEWHGEIRALVTRNEKTMKGTTKKRREGCLPKKGGGDEDDDVDGDDHDVEDVETVLIDVRNHKECQIGSFAPGISIDPHTKTFAQFPKWVKENSTTTMANKRILMYCTGGIRCEKASAYVRKLVPQNRGIYHLKGGIHKYLEEFGRGAGSDKGGGGTQDDDDDDDANVRTRRSSHDDFRDECLFVGKNFVFDRRGQLDARGHGMREGGAPSRAEGCASSPRSSRSNDDVDAEIVVVGRCLYCKDPYDVFRPECVCTVCREPVLACERCRSDLRQGQGILRGLLVQSSNDEDHATAIVEIACRAEYHCEDHFHLNKCYFTCLSGFSVADCNEQLERLRLHNLDLEGIGRKGRNSRRTLRRQMEKIEAYVMNMLSGDSGKGKSTIPEPAILCRHCGSSTCASDCWGFHGGSTRMVNKSKENHCEDAQMNGGANSGDNVDSNRLNRQRTRVTSNQRPGKRLKRQNHALEIEVLHLCSPPSRHRNDATGLRVPPPVVRTLKSGVKGRWCGKTVRWVLMNEFGEFLRGLTREQADENIERVVASLVRINGVPVKSPDVVLRNMDTFERIIHWHEPPITVPQKISLTKQILPVEILPEEFKATGNPILYCINKPSSVPVYPAGPYYANSLLLMVEAQEGLPPKTLIPLHRIDRATSGLLLCADASSVAKVIQAKIISKCDESNPPVSKLYLARVKGKFPSSSVEGLTMPNELVGVASIVWCGDDANIIEVNAPIAVRLEPKENTPSGSIADQELNSMMHRTIAAEGKHSTSRFKLISYDAFTNHSLISCAPITGRGHQLRVHLQLIGFSIHNDVEYGGAANVEKSNDQKNLSARSMLEAALAATSCHHEKTITSSEVESALQLCKCCIGGLDGIGASFNTAQLLAGGHAIDLHAYKYCLYFKEKEATIEMSTDLPSWATSFVDMMPNTLNWLK